ncbi:MAG: Cytochrome c oxidase polypeptide III, partial [uncultured Solirubrobacteraceae bacterium]
GRRRAPRGGSRHPPPRPARGEPELARRPAAAGDAAVHHLRDHGLRGLLHGLLLHPHRRRERVAGPRDRTARARRGRQHGDPPLELADAPLGADERQERQPLRAEGRDVHDVPARRDVPARPGQRVRPHRLLPRRPRAGLGVLRAHRPARRPRLHRPAAARRGHGALIPRALLQGGAPRARDSRDLLALRRRHVDRRLHDHLHHL